MSLINDALRRAKEVQPQAPPPGLPDLQLRPIEPAQQARHGLGLLLPIALTVVALCALFFLWRLSRGDAVNRPAQAKTRTTSPPTVDLPSPPAPTTAEATPAAVSQAPDPSPTSPQPPPASAALMVASNTPAPANALAPVAPPPPNQEAPVTNLPFAAAPPPPRPPPLKLQGIVFNPENPSATINGKPLFIGEHIGEFQVVAIGRDTATLVGPGQTNLLTLP
jgi:hypothetical protein